MVDVTPTLDGFDVAVHRGEVRAHRYDRYMAPLSFAPRRNIARPLVVPAAVLLDRLEAECIEIPSELAQFSYDPRLDLDRLGLRPAGKQEPFPPAARSYAALLKPPNQIGIRRFGRGNIPALSILWSESSYSTTGSCHSLRIRAICCSCRLPRRRKCPEFRGRRIDPVPADPDAQANPAL